MGFLDSLANADFAVRDQLGETVVYTPGSGPPVTVVAIFDALFRLVMAGSEPGVESATPAIWFVSSDLPMSALTDRQATIVRAGITYTPWEIQPDGLDTVRMLLHEV